MACHKDPDNPRYCDTKTIRCSLRQKLSLFVCLFVSASQLRSENNQISTYFCRTNQSQFSLGLRSQTWTLFNMDQYDQEDLELWESTETCPKSRHELWRFGVEKLHICKEDGVVVLDLEVLVHMELALFYTFYSFWATVPILAKGLILSDEAQAAIRYHGRLHAAITRILLKSKSQRLSATPPLLQPWLKRTLCLFQHDIESRKRFMQVNFPSRLLESSTWNKYSIH